MKISRMTVPGALLATLTACGGGSGGGDGVPPPPPVQTTYSASLTGVEIDRTADQSDIVIDGLPAAGATITVDE